MLNQVQHDNTYWSAAKKLTRHGAQLLFPVGEDYALQQDEETQHEACRNALPVRLS